MMVMNCTLGIQRQPGHGEHRVADIRRNTSVGQIPLAGFQL